MAYIKQIWQNGPNSTTPLSASRLGYMENGIQGAATTADNALASANGKVTYSDLALTVDPIRAGAFGGTARTKPYQAFITLNADITYGTAPATGDYFGGTWGALYDADGMFRAGGSGTGGYTAYPRILIPVSGWWELTLNYLGQCTGPVMMANSIAGGSGSAQPTINNALAFAQTSFHAAANMKSDARVTAYYGAGTYIYWSLWASAAMTGKASLFGARTFFHCRFVGPV